MKCTLVIYWEQEGNNGLRAGFGSCNVGTKLERAFGEKLMLKLRETIREVTEEVTGKKGKEIIPLTIAERVIRK